MSEVPAGAPLRLTGHRFFENPLMSPLSCQVDPKSLDQARWIGAAVKEVLYGVQET